MIQTLLPIFPRESTRINDLLAFKKEDGHVYYFKEKRSLDLIN